MSRIYEWTPPYPKTLEDARAENLFIHDMLQDLLAHAPGILELARAASVISGDKHRGQVESYSAMVYRGRAALEKLRKDRLRANVKRARVFSKKTERN